MKKMILVGAVASLAVFSGCDSSSSSGTSNSSSSTTNLPTTPTEITSQTGAQRALQSATMVGFYESASGFANSVSVAPSNKRQTVPCPSGGNMTFNFTSSGYGATFNSCDQGDGIIDGSFTTATSLQSSGASEIDITFTNLEIDSSDSYTKMNLNMNTDIGANLSMYKHVMDGKIDYDAKAVNNSGYIQYTDFIVLLEGFLTGSPTISYDGTISATSSLYSCLNGTYTYETVTPLQGSTFESAVSGEIKINGVSYVFNSGTVTATTPGGQTFTVDPSAEPTCN